MDAPIKLTQQVAPLTSIAKEDCTEHMKRVKEINRGMAVAGAWVALAPFILGLRGMAPFLWNGLIAGIAVMALAVAAALSKDPHTIEGMNWVTAALGVWLLLAPFILGYSVLAAALWSDIISGIVILGLSAWAESALPDAIERPA